ncbi:cupin domain-containing protein [Leucobacter luti]|uniref:cupin domain-containing protein n=1 Tax=Leucobacter luti TaxID=340320 RepID=UPI003CFF1F13
MSAQPSAALPPEAAAWVDRLGLEPLEHEGGLFRRMHLDDHSSAIYYLLASPDFSALHALDSVEVYHWYAGSPLSLLLLHPDGRSEEVLLGPDHEAGQLPQAVVPPGVMQGSSPLGEWSLIGTTMSPPFHWEGFELGERETLVARYPDSASRIAELTRNLH